MLKWYNLQVLQLLLNIDCSGCIKCWHYLSGQCLYTIRERRQTLGLTYHPRLPKLVTVGDDTKLILYDEETRTQERIFQASGAPDMMNGHKSRVFCVCFNPASNHEIVSGGWDDTIQFWDVRQPFVLRHITGVHICGEGIAIRSDGKQILTCAWQKENAVQLWDYSTEKLIANLEPEVYKSQLYCGKFINDIFFVCGGSDNNYIRVVDLRTNSTISGIKNLPGGVYSIDIGPISATQLKRSRPTDEIDLPKLAFCSDKAIFEIELS
ncbi:WD repeat-containing protein 5 homolog isoform X2 [Belonocnema kinseyi]|uniref:WD repeat-containing protein 5 homolog isoform X2 n=1 Tax=Belonocnema kinseyi TaxID=2817044 RepID=UPI00143D0734|nr:WD repeat-containing protein 5 homolog isoform X2 [Belonocnema kinseyi]